MLMHLLIEDLGIDILHGTDKVYIDSFMLPIYIHNNLW